MLKSPSLENRKSLPDTDSKMGHRLRRWPVFESVLGRFLIFSNCILGESLPDLGGVDRAWFPCGGVVKRYEYVYFRST